MGNTRGPSAILARNGRQGLTVSAVFRGRKNGDHKLLLLLLLLLPLLLLLVLLLLLLLPLLLLPLLLPLVLILLFRASTTNTIG